MPRPSARFGGTLAALRERTNTQTQARQQNIRAMAGALPAEYVDPNAHQPALRIPTPVEPLPSAAQDHLYDAYTYTRAERRAMPNVRQMEQVTDAAQAQCIARAQALAAAGWPFTPTATTHSSAFFNGTFTTTSTTSTTPTILYNLHNQANSQINQESDMPSIRYSCPEERPTIFISGGLDLSVLEPAASYVYTPNIEGHDPVRWAAEVIQHVPTLDFSDQSFETHVNLVSTLWPWHHELRQKHPLHPVVRKIMYSVKLHHHLIDWRLVANEFPHLPKGDAAASDTPMVAFTEDIAKGMAGRVTVTKLGKYLKRIAPTLPDTDIRDFVMMCKPGEVVHTRDMEKMLEVITSGPGSCMSGGDYRTHPYNVYDPKYGWGMAYIVRNGSFVGRALTYEADGYKCFVRTYGDRESNGFTASSETLNAWMKANDYANDCQWPNGAKVAKIYNDSYVVAPYIDGEAHYLVDEGKYLTITDDDDEADFCARNTGGDAEPRPHHTCSCCDERISSIEFYAGEDEDEGIGSCCTSSYHWVMGRRRNHYYLHEDNVVTTVNGVHLDENYAEELGFVEIDDKWYDTDDLVLLADDEYAPGDDIDCDTGDGSTYVRLAEDAENGSDIALRTDCWRCEVSGGWYYAPETDPEETTIRHHPDHPPEVDYAD